MPLEERQRGMRVLAVSNDSGWSSTLDGLVESLLGGTTRVEATDPIGFGRLAEGAPPAIVVIDERLPWVEVFAVLTHPAAVNAAALVARNRAGTWEATLPGSRGHSEPVAWSRLEVLLPGLPAPAKPQAAGAEFLSRMSHELRTPLNAILGFAQLLELEELTDDQRDSVAQILSAGRHLLAMINEVLDITRLDAGRLSISVEDVDVRSAVEEALELAGPEAAAQGITLASGDGISEELRVRGDRGRVRQVLLALLSNAIKYNHAGGRVEIRAQHLPYGGARIAVADDGPGIAPDALSRLFVPFDRLGAERTGVPGTGLGLTLSRRLVEVMGGAIGVESAAGEGTVAWFELPGPHKERS